MGNRDKNEIYFYKLKSGSVSQLIKYENLRICSFTWDIFYVDIQSVICFMLAGTSEDKWYKNWSLQCLWEYNFEAVNETFMFYT